jgi:hypothetical protein
MLPVSAAPTNLTRGLVSRVAALAAHTHRLHADARGRWRPDLGPGRLDADLTSALEVCAFAIPQLTTLGACAAGVERRLASTGTAASSSAPTDSMDDFAQQVALADLALAAHARVHRLDRHAHRHEVVCASQAELHHLAERIKDGHERGFLTPPIAALAESLAQAVQLAEHDRQGFRDAAVDWSASAVTLYAVATL